MPTSGAEIRQSRILLDTSAYSHLRRGDDQLVEAVARADVVVIPTTVLGELEAGFRLGNRHRQNRQNLADFLDEPYVTVVEVTAAVAYIYGEIFATLRRAGTPLPSNDIWIAASARAHNAHLVTYDVDFERVPDVAVSILIAR